MTTRRQPRIRDRHRIQIWIDAALQAEVLRIARKRNMSRSWVARELLAVGIQHSNDLNPSSNGD